MRFLSSLPSASPSTLGDPLFEASSLVCPALLGGAAWLLPAVDEVFFLF